MKNQIWQRLRTAPSLRLADIFILIVPILVWAALFHARPMVMDLICSRNPTPCVAENVFWIDRLAIHVESPIADNHSFTTQNLSGILALIVPLFWVVFEALRGRAAGYKKAAIAALTDVLLLAQSVAWNGVLIETARLLVQRPRPFVYSNPILQGADPAHYTSFYSGHTSFAALAGTSMVMTLIGRKAGLPLIISASLVAMTLVFLTGIFRVMAGRHFVTDVLAAAVAGFIVAAFIAYLHRRPIVEINSEANESI